MKFKYLLVIILISICLTIRVGNINDIDKIDNSLLDLKNDPHLKKTNPQIVNNESTLIKINEFFRKSSYENDDTALTSIFLLVGGILIFLISIQLICWNEKKEIRRKELLAYYDDQNCNYIEKGKMFKMDESIKDNLFIINGIL